jgi:DNA-binding transcriptional regulator YdaS (Cro superfamily)
MKLETYLDPRGMVNALAEKLAVPPALLSQWKVGARPVPAERCMAIERATGGAVRCEDLRPDLADDWAYLRATDCPVEKVGAGETAQPERKAA